MGLCLSYSFYKTSIQKVDETKYQYLKQVEYEDTVIFHPRITYGKVIKVYDGDTITIATKLPNDDTFYRFSVRMRGIDSPEIRGKSENEKALAIKSRDALAELIFHEIVMLGNVEYEKYGRILADVHLVTPNPSINTSINQWMLDHKYAVPYDGGTKTIPKEWV